MSAVATGTLGNPSEIDVGYSGVVSGTGNLTIIGGSGTNSATAPYIIELGGQSTYVGATTVNNAVVSGGSILPATTVLNLINNGWFNFSGSAATQTIAGLSGDATGRLSITNAFSADSLTIDSAAGQTCTFAGVIGAEILLNKTNGSNAELSLAISGSGTQVLSGPNTYSGGTTVSGGTLQLGNVSALGSGGLTADAGVVDLAGFRPTVTTLNGAAGTITSSVSGGSLTVTAGGDFSGVLQNGQGTLALQVSGGALVLGGSNTYSGGTTLSGGTLQLGNAAALGSGALAANAGIVDLNGFGASVTTLTGSAGTITSTSSSGGSLTVIAGGAFSGTIEDDVDLGGGPVSLIVAGGELTLSSTNDYSGGTLVTSSGTLILADNEALAGGSSLIVGDASLFAPAIPNLAASGITPASVPEPTTLVLFTAVICGAAVYQRLCLRRKKR